LYDDVNACLSRPNAFINIQYGKMIEQEPSYPVKFLWCSDIENFFRKNRIYLAPPLKTKNIYKFGETIVIVQKTIVEAYASMCHHGFFNCGSYSYSWSKLKPGTTIGRYSSVSGGVNIMSDHHPINRISTSVVSYDDRFENIAAEDFNSSYKIEPFGEKESIPPVIGNDVWVGADVLLKGGVKIGDGAVVAARSVVTRDVPPYAIVAGAPAQIKKFRFSEKVIGELTALQWWKYNFVDLPLPFSEVEQFIGLLEEKIDAKKIVVFSPPKLDVGAEIQKIIRSRKKINPNHIFTNVVHGLKKIIRP
jgi:virginiamycin A acetyltransferase